MKPHEHARANAARARRASNALSRYSPHDLIATAATDLLTDLLHCFGREEFDGLIGQAETHYAAELAEAQTQIQTGGNTDGA